MVRTRGSYCYVNVTQRPTTSIRSRDLSPDVYLSGVYVIEGAIEVGVYGGRIFKWTIWYIASGQLW